MTLLAHMDRVESYAWSNEFHLPFESAYGRLQKFAWVNVLNATEIAQQLFGKRLSTQEPFAMDLFEAVWMKKAKVTLPAGLSLDEGLASTHGLDWMRRLCRTDVFRYCETCLTDGFHSLLHQIDGLSMCPSHKRLLRSGCKSCGAEMPLAVCKPAFAFAFTCPKCLEPFARYHQPQRWPRNEQVESEIHAAFDPIAEWLRKLTTFSVVGEHAPLSQLSIAGEFAADSDRVVIFDIARRLVPFPLADEFCSSSMRPLRLVHVISGGTESRFVEQLEAHERRKSMFRALSSQLKKTALAGHQNCLAAARRGVILRADVHGDLLEQESGLCPLAAGFIRWQKRFWTQSAADRKFDRARVHETVLGPHAEFLLDQWAQFYSSVATAYVCEELHKQGKRPQIALGSNLRDLLDRYCCGTADADAAWAIARRSNDCEERYLVMGDPQFLRGVDYLATAISNASCGIAD